MSNQRSAVFRWVSNIALGLGGLTFVASLLWFWGGAGMYGSPVADAWQVDPLTGFPNYWSFWMIWVVAAGPMAVLPCVVVTRYSPHAGAALMMVSAAVVAEAGMRASRMYWGFATDSALLIAGLISIPLLLLAVLLLGLATFRPRDTVAALAIALVLVAGFGFRLSSYRANWNAVCPANQHPTSADS